MLSNLGITGARGILRDHLGCWVASFSLHLGIVTNNLAELAAVRQGLEIAWQLGFKFIRIEIDSNMVLNWLTNTTMNYPTNMKPLICDCRSLMDRDWVVQVQHIYCEANACVDTLAKWETHQQNLLSVYNGCPSFVYTYYVKDLTDLGSTRLCAQGSAIDVV